jgi:diguanylate cyclase (GGDEF)-like protein/PAS domain S-box-containing protein
VDETATSTSEMLDPAKDAALLSLLRSHPGALVSAIDSEGLFVELPASIELVGQHVIRARSALDLVQPASRAAVIEAWDRARTIGAAVASVVLVNGADAACYFVDARHRHGVLIGLIVADAHIELVAALAGHPPVMPKTGRIDKDQSAVICSADDRICQILGFRPEDLVGRRSLEFIHPDDQDSAVEAWMEMLASPGAATRLRTRHLRHDGSWVWMELTNTNLLGQPDSRVVTEMLDISDEMAALETLRQREQLLGRLAEALPSGVLHVDRHGKVIYANARLHRVIGIGPSATVDAQLATVIPEDRPALAAALHGVLDDGFDIDLEVRFRLPGEVKLLMCSIAIRVLTDSDDAPAGAILCIDDVTEASELRAELERRATVDHLTGCLNRTAVISELERVLLLHDATAAGSAVVFLDLDGFKEVNDTFGHEAGDQLLASAASRLRQAVRSVDVVGRLGGDEFIVVLPSVRSIDEATQAGHRLSQSLSEPLEVVRGLPIRIRSSIGVAWSRATDVTADALIAAADRAMYQSKRDGTSLPVSTSL